MFFQLQQLLLHCWNCKSVVNDLLSRIDILIYWASFNTPTISPMIQNKYRISPHQSKLSWQRQKMKCLLWFWNSLCLCSTGKALIEIVERVTLKLKLKRYALFWSDFSQRFKRKLDIPFSIFKEVFNSFLRHFIDMFFLDKLCQHFQKWLVSKVLSFRKIHMKIEHLFRV